MTDELPHYDYYFYRFSPAHKLLDRYPENTMPSVIFCLMQIEIRASLCGDSGGLARKHKYPRVWEMLDFLSCRGGKTLGYVCHKCHSRSLLQRGKSSGYEFFTLGHF